MNRRDDGKGNPPEERKLLEEILREALTRPNPLESVTEEDLEALADVARRHRGAPFSLDPVAVDMVQAILGSSFGRARGAVLRRREVAAVVAGTLADDPGCEERMRSLWSRLLEREEERP